MSQQINLLPAALSRPRFSFTSPGAVASLVALTAALTSLVALYEHSRLETLKSEAAAVERTVREARAQHEKAAAQRKARKPDPGDEAKLAELEAQLRSRQEIAEALNSGAVGTTAGFSEYMMALSRQSLPGVWLTGFDITAGGKELTLSGRALSADLVPAYLQRLTQEPPLQGRRFASMTLNQPPASGAAKHDKGHKSEPSGEVRKGAPYVEFTVSSAPAEGSSAPMTAPTPPARESSK